MLPGVAIATNWAEHPPKQLELGDDVTRREPQRLPFARVVADDRRERAAPVQPFRLRVREVRRELRDERGHVPELAHAAEPAERRNRVFAKPLVHDGQREFPGSGADLVGEIEQWSRSRGGNRLHTGAIGIPDSNLSKSSLRIRQPTGVAPP